MEELGRTLVIIGSTFTATAGLFRLYVLWRNRKRNALDELERILNGRILFIDTHFVSETQRDLQITVLWDTIALIKKIKVSRVFK